MEECAPNGAILSPVHNHGSALHHPTNPVENHTDIGERVALDGDDVREEAGSDLTECRGDA
jgi:hypothetical protein